MGHALQVETRSEMTVLTFSVIMRIVLPTEFYVLDMVKGLRKFSLKGGTPEEMSSRATE